METNYSKDALVKFLDYLQDKGLMAGATVSAWRTAVSRLLVDLSAGEEVDVRTIDVDIAVRKFSNKNPNKYTPESLSAYRSRTVLAIQEFSSWVENPAGYKPRGTPVSTRKNDKSDKKNDGTAKNTTQQRSADLDNSTAVPLSKDNPNVSLGLSLPFPLRTDFLAQVVVPRDMSVDEARRLGAFLVTLSVDFRPGEN